MSTFTIPPRGNFDALNLPDWDREMISSAFEAVASVDGGWDFLSTYEPGDGGFMFSTPPPMMERINNAVNERYGGHSGASYGMTMRNIEFIAKKGWDAYAREILKKRGPPPPPSLEKQVATLSERVKALEAENASLRASEANRPSVMDQAAAIDKFVAENLGNEEMLASPAAFADAIAKDPAMRAMIPDIDEQAAAMKKFSQGRMSYAEMRSLCG